jgi:hypothetical protein
VLVERNGPNETWVLEGRQSGGHAPHQQAAITQVEIVHGLLDHSADLWLRFARRAGLLRGLNPESVAAAGNFGEEVLGRDRDLVEHRGWPVYRRYVGELGQRALGPEQRAQLPLVKEQLSWLL